MQTPYERAGFTAAAATAFDNLLQSDDITTRKVTILSGQNLLRATLLGKVTASGKFVKSLSASSDGSEEPDMILAQDCDASGGDKEALAYETATVVGSALILGTGHTIASIREGLRAKEHRY